MIASFLMGHKNSGLYLKSESFHMANSADLRKHLKYKGAEMTRIAAIGGIIYVVICVVVAEWIVPPRLLRNPLVFAMPIVLIVAFGIISHIRHGETARDLGFRTDNFIAAMRILAFPMIAVASLAAIGGWFAGTLRIQPDRVFPRLLRLSVWLPIWGFLQQYALQVIIHRRAQVIWGEGIGSILIVAALFAALHLPNPWLTFATLAGGLVWAYTYQRAPNLYALALSHWLMTLALVFTLLGSAERGMKVGTGYLLR
jgi:membrane protease YdiL (CAAX protease family)